MKHEFADEQLHINLAEVNNKPNDHASKIVNENNFQNKLSEVQVTIAFTESCDHIDEILRSKLERFWETFFTLSGAEVSFDYL